MNSESILCTVHKDVAASFLHRKEAENLRILHLPLETYKFAPDPEESDQVQKNLENFSFIIYGNLRNARYFLQWVEAKSLKNKIQQTVNLAADSLTAEFLENQGIPAILPAKEAKPIDVLEFLLRISREGKTLYPTTEQKTEEIPGLLHELEMDVAEFTVCRETAMPAKQLQKYRNRLKRTGVKAVLFHNRSSVVRTRKAFPDLDLSAVQRIAASPGVVEKLREEGLETNIQAHGSWSSVAKVLKEV